MTLTSRPRGAAFFLALAATAGCGGGGSAEPAGPLRLLSEPAQEILVPSSLRRLEATFQFQLVGRESVDAWTVTGIRRSTLLRDSGLKLWPKADEATTLTRAVDFDAAAVDLVDITTSGLDGGALSLWWAREGESFDASRRAEIEVPSRGLAGRATERLRLTGQDAWQGRVRRLRLEARPTRPGAIVVAAVVGGVETLDEERLSAALSRPQLLDIGGQMRSGRAAVPDLALDWEAVVPPKAQLSFAYGVPPTVREVIHFRVSAEPRQGAEADGEKVPLFEDRVVPAEPAERASWLDAEVDLAELAGETVRLRFETSVEGGFAGGTAAEIEADPLAGLAYWGHPEIRSATPSVRPNVLLISIDTLRADRLSLYGYHRKTSPRLDRWADGSAVVFEKAVAASPWTIPSHASMLSGLDAMRHGANYMAPASLALETLGEHLWRAGYRTLAVTGGGLLHPRWGWAQGIDRFHYSIERTADELSTGVDTALALLEANRQTPFFLFFHTYEVHEPYRPRQPYFDRFSDTATTLLARTRQHPGLDPETHLHRNYFVTYSADDPSVETPLTAELADLPTDLYDSGIAYADDQIGRLLARLEELDLTSRTLVIVTSDHGEMLGEHGLVGHAFLYEENLLVPLVIRPPGREPVVGRIAEQVRSIDLVPTVLDAVGLTPSSELDGVSLLPLIRGDTGKVPGTAWSYAASGTHGLSLRQANRLKYIYRNNAWPPNRGVEELYRLTEDPAENNDLAPTSERLPSLRQAAEQRFREAASGLWIDLRASPGADLEGELHGVEPSNKIKSVDGSCDCARTIGLDALRFAVPAGASYSLLVETPLAAPLYLAIDGGGRGAFTTTLTADRLTSATTLRFDGDRWTEEPTADPSESASITFRRSGLAAAAEGDSLQDNAALREQLKALGYVD